MNRTLARLVLEFFRDDVDARPDYFVKCTERDWRSTKTWLDSSGLALYFLERLKNLHLEDSIPTAILDELERNRADRAVEVKQRLECFAELLRLFQKENVRFVVEKGIALVPDYCPDVCYRFQVDFDFLVDRVDVERCHELLLSLGYRYQPTIDGERRFNKGELRIPTIREFYKPKQRHTVELHFNTSEETRAKLESAVPHKVGSLVFPVLPKAELFVEYVLHFVKHLRGGWIRADALLEYRRFIGSVGRDQVFWDGVRRRCSECGDLRESLAVTAMLANEVLGMPVSPELLDLVNATSVDVQQWVKRYAWNVLLSEYPGTKLCVLLELAFGRRPWLSCARSIFPYSCWPCHIAEADGTADSKRQALRAQSLFFLKRCWYHLRESVRMSYELLAWAWVRSREKHGWSEVSSS